MDFIFYNISDCHFKDLHSSCSSDVPINFCCSSCHCYYHSYCLCQLHTSYFSPLCLVINAYLIMLIHSRLELILSTFYLQIMSLSLVCFTIYTHLQSLLTSFIGFLSSLTYSNEHPVLSSSCYLAVISIFLLPTV